MSEHARVLTLEGPRDRVDEMAAYIRENILPGSLKLAGFRQSLWMIDRESGRGTVVTVFESRDALEATNEGAARFRQGAAEALGVNFTAVEHCEVIASAAID